MPDNDGDKATMLETVADLITSDEPASCIKSLSASATVAAATPVINNPSAVAVKVPLETYAELSIYPMSKPLLVLLVVKN